GFHRLASGDVFELAEVVLRNLSLIPDEGDMGGGPYDAAVGKNEPALVRVVIVTGCHPCLDGLAEGRVVRVGIVAPPLPHEDVGGPAEQGAEGRVDTGEDACGVGDRGADGCVFEADLESPLGSLADFFGLVLLGLVHDGPRHPHDGSAPVELGHASGVYPSLYRVAKYKPVPEAEGPALLDSSRPGAGQSFPVIGVNHRTEQVTCGLRRALNPQDAIELRGPRRPAG